MKRTGRYLDTMMAAAKRAGCFADASTRRAFHLGWDARAEASLRPEGPWDDKDALASARWLLEHGSRLGEHHAEYDGVMKAWVALDRVIRENRRLNRSIDGFIEHQNELNDQIQRLKAEIAELTATPEPYPHCGYVYSNGDRCGKEPAQHEFVRGHEYIECRCDVMRAMVNKSPEEVNEAMRHG